MNACEVCKGAPTLGRRHSILPVVLCPLCTDFFDGEVARRGALGRLDPVGIVLVSFSFPTPIQHRLIRHARKLISAGIALAA